MTPVGDSVTDSALSGLFDISLLQHANRPHGYVCGGWQIAPIGDSFVATFLIDFVGAAKTVEASNKFDKTVRRNISMIQS